MQFDGSGIRHGGTDRRLISARHISLQLIQRVSPSLLRCEKKSKSRAVVDDRSTSGKKLLKLRQVKLGEFTARACALQR